MHSGSIELVDWLINELGFDVQQVTKVMFTIFFSTSDPYPLLAVCMYYVGMVVVVFML